MMNNGKIYKLVNTENSKIYVGSSNYQYLSSRLNTHKQLCKDTSGRRGSILYKTMREIGPEKFSIELIEVFSCENKIQLAEREQHWIEQLKPELNMFRAIKNPLYDQECRDKNERRERSKKFYENHKELVLERQKLYAEKNKDVISERRKKYREENKEQLKEKKSQKITCECGCEVTCGKISIHRETKKHKNKMIATSS